MTALFSRATALASAASLALLPGLAIAQDVAEPQGWAEPGQIGMLRAVTPIQESIIAFHDGVLMWTISGIVLLVLVLLLVVILRFNAKANPRPASFTHNTMVEVLWTVLPIVVLVVIAIPSFGVLSDQMTIPDGERRYLGSNIFSFGEVEVPAPELTVKATGEQWYWNWEFVDQGVSFDSSLLPEDERLEVKPGQPRLLAVDNELVVPVDTTVRLQVTASPSGVMHAFGLPSFGLKVDAVPGRLNESWFNATETGIYYGQCSELCGKDHAYMPLAIRVVEREQFDTWLQALIDGNIREAAATLPPLS